MKISHSQIIGLWIALFAVYFLINSKINDLKSTERNDFGNLELAQRNISETNTKIGEDVKKIKDDVQKVRDIQNEKINTLTTNVGTAKRELKIFTQILEDFIKIMNNIIGKSVDKKKSKKKGSE